MTGFEIAGGFATYALFRQERETDSEMSEEEFLKWLATRGFDPIRKSIQENKELQNGIAKLPRSSGRTRRCSSRRSKS